MASPTDLQAPVVAAPRAFGAGCGGFSQVELLVVLVVLAVLASLLLPVVQRGRTASQNAACMGNLRTIGFGLAAYANDNQGAIPSGQEFETNRDSGERERTMSGQIGMKTGWMYRYIEDSYPRYPSVFTCPADQTPQKGVDPKTGRDLGKYHNYTNNVRVFIAYTDGIADDWKRPIKIWEIHNKIVYADGPTPAEVVNWKGPGAQPSTSPIFGVQGALTETLVRRNLSRRHNGRANALFGDGSVRSVLPDDPAVPDLVRLSPPK